MSAGFTKGPWCARPPVTETKLWAIEHGSPERVGDICYLTLNRDQIGANAHLIAAAPDLFEALESLIPGRLCGENWNLSDSEHVPIDITLGELRAARTALAKARGEAK